MALLTGALTGLFFAFDAARGSPAVALPLAVMWAVAPAIVGVVVLRLQRSAPGGDSGCPRSGLPHRRGLRRS